VQAEIAVFRAHARIAEEVETLRIVAPHEMLSRIGPFPRDRPPSRRRGASRMTDRGREFQLLLARAAGCIA